MALDLTFPVFYYCAIQGNCGVTQQFHQVNILFTGWNWGENSAGIDKTFISAVLNGRKLMPQWIVEEVKELSDEDLMARFKKLAFNDVYAVAEALARLVGVCSLSAARRRELLRYAGEPENVYLFLCDVFRAAISNTANPFAKLKKEDRETQWKAALQLIEACRNDTLPKEEPSGSEEPPSPPTEEPQETPEAPATSSESEMLKKLKIKDPELEDLEPLEPLDFEGLSELSEQEQGLLVVTRCQPPQKSSFKAAAEFYYDYLQFDAALDAESIGPELEIADILKVLTYGDLRSSYLLEIGGEKDEVLEYLTYKSGFDWTKAMLVMTDLSSWADLSSLDYIYAIMQQKVDPQCLCLFGARQHPEGFAEDQIGVRILLT